uniref:Uncharacterized protein n=1 Tax=Romanomermis culicivorax TaxID=13658 RepID=A0A915KNN7_ROMCU
MEPTEAESSSLALARDDFSSISNLLENEAKGDEICLKSQKNWHSSSHLSMTPCVLADLVVVAVVAAVYCCSFCRLYEKDVHCPNMFLVNSGVINSSIRNLTLISSGFISVIGTSAKSIAPFTKLSRSLAKEG